MPACPRPSVTRPSTRRDWWRCGARAILGRDVGREAQDAGVRSRQGAGVPPGTRCRKDTWRHRGGDVTIACWEPGQTSPNHLHPNATEIYFCVRGGDAMHTPDATIDITPGSFVVHLPGELHEYANDPARTVLSRAPWQRFLSAHKGLAEQSTGRRGPRTPPCSRRPADQLSGARTKQRMPTCGVQQAIARPVGLSVRFRIRWSGTRRHSPSISAS
jgi:mannose-6-phosphate isomerase-like protein (cupin superfamily)